MTNTYTADALRAEIAKRAPWYQAIAFDEYGLTTADDPEWAIYDGSPDNVLAGETPEEAARYRPIPKWNFIKSLLPPIEGKTVMEIGCANGFFSFEFAKAGAAHVWAVDRGPWLKNGQWAAEVLGLQDRVTFIAEDFFRLGWAGAPLCEGSTASTYPGTWIEERPQVAFTSSALIHMHYPFLALHKIASLPTETLIIDDGYIDDPEGDSLSTSRFNWVAGHPSHAVGHSIRAVVKYLWRCGVSPSNLEFRFYPTDEGQRPKRVVLVAHLDRDQEFVTAEDREHWDHIGVNKAARYAERAAVRIRELEAELAELRG